MLRNVRRLIGLLLPIALVTLNLLAFQPGVRAAKNAGVFTASDLSLVAVPTMVTVCPGQGNLTASVVRLNASATSSSGNQMRYRWSTSAGRIDGNGPTVTWDLSGVQPGYYKAYVDIDTGSGDALCHTFSSTTVLVNECLPPRSVCPHIVIACPDRPVAGEALDFSASITGATPNVAAIYNWTVSAGTIIGGQGTTSTKVDTTGLAGQSLRATLHIDGYANCSATCLVQLPVPLECRKFDEFPDLARNDEKARLDNYAIELQNDPTATANVVVHPGQRGRPSDVQKHASRIVDYLINSRGVDARRIVTVVGSPRADLLVDLWACPQGVKPSVTTP